MQKTLTQNHFSLRSINKWNALPENITRTKDANYSKTNIDKYWNSDDVMYECHLMINSTTVLNGI